MIHKTDRVCYGLQMFGCKVTFSHNLEKERRGPAIDVTEVQSMLESLTLPLGMSPLSVPAGSGPPSRFTILSHKDLLNNERATLDGNKGAQVRLFLATVLPLWNSYLDLLSQ